MCDAEHDQKDCRHDCFVVLYAQASSASSSSSSSSLFELTPTEFVLGVAVVSAALADLDSEHNLGTLRTVQYNVRQCICIRSGVTMKKLLIPNTIHGH